MAGEWIKVRTDLKDDPSVFRLAKALKMDRLSIVGRLFALWAWVDFHAVGGKMDGVDASDVDAMCEKKGFALALVSVGWLEIGDGFIVIPKYDRHNGNSAKERSLKNARQARWRDGKASTYPQPPVDDDVDGGTSTGTSTREEKRREEPETTPPQEGGGERLADARASRLPHHWAPSETLTAWAKSERPDLIGDDLLRTTQDFRDHYRSTGSRREDWDAAWQKWVRGQRTKQPAAAAFQPPNAASHSVEKAREVIAETRAAARTAVAMPKAIRDLLPKRPASDQEGP